MSYAAQRIYEIISEGSYSVSRNCPGCGKKTDYINTNRFRVNANGNRIDVWLIYHCPACKHTLNITIYERKAAGKISPAEYQKFMANDMELAISYGRDKTLFTNQKLTTADNNMEYHLKLLRGDDEWVKKETILIKNPWKLKIRPDKLLAELLDISRNKVKELEKSGCITVTYDGDDGIIISLNM